jgi:hypothetical protein
VVSRKNAPKDDGEWRKLASGMEDGARRREWRMELDAAARMEGGKNRLQRRREIGSRR